MNRPKTVGVLLAILALSFLLAACGGSDDSSGESDANSAAPSGTTATTPDKPGGGGGQTPAGDSAADSTGSDAGDDGGAGAARKPASLTTDPGSIRGAIVTESGAVQTLEPSAADQKQAMDNSYASIKVFGEEATREEATDITFALVQYLTAKAQQDSATACARLYSILRDNVARLGAKLNDSVEGCTAAYAELMKRSPGSASAESAEIDVASIRRDDGNRAFVIYKTPDTLSADMPMFEEEGVWKVGAVDAYVLTPAQLGRNPE